MVPWGVANYLGEKNEAKRYHKRITGSQPDLKSESRTAKSTKRNPVLEKKKWLGRETLS